MENVQSIDLEQQEKENKIKKTVVKNKIINFIPIIGLVCLALLFFITALAKNTDVMGQFEVVIKKALIVGFLATGATFIFAIGSFDLSLGANLITSAAISAYLYTITGSLILMFVSCIVISVVLALVNALLAMVFKLPVFMVTIAMMTLLGAFSSFFISKVSKTGIDTKLSRLSSADHAVYVVLNNVYFQMGILIIFVAICAFMFNYMKMGRRQKFLGGNPTCAKLTGINALKITIFSFIIAGIGVGLAAFFSIIKDVKVTSATSSGVGMNMLIAIVFGGMAISGGPESKALAAFIGGFSMAFLDQFMTILELQNGDAVTQIVKAVLFLVVVTLLGLGKRKGLLKR